MDMLINREFAETLIERLHQANMRQFTVYAETVGIRSAA